MSGPLSERRAEPRKLRQCASVEGGLIKVVGVRSSVVVQQLLRRRRRENMSCP
jgi:hypothetical protein